MSTLSRKYAYIHTYLCCSIWNSCQQLSSEPITSIPLHAHLRKHRRNHNWSMQVEQTTTGKLPHVLRTCLWCFSHIFCPTKHSQCCRSLFQCKQEGRVDSRNNSSSPQPSINFKGCSDSGKNNTHMTDNPQWFLSPRAVSPSQSARSLATVLDLQLVYLHLPVAFFYDDDL